MDSSALIGGKQKLLNQYYLEQKNAFEKYGKNTVVFIQKGDFYELYSVEADFPKLCEILNLSCTRANTKKKDKISYENPQMAGFQHKFIDRYLKVLLDRNYTIVLIDETGINKEKNKSTKIRTVTRVVTPSTFLESIDTNILLCVYITKRESSIASVDMSTGKICLFGEYIYSTELIRDIIAKTNPRELVFFFTDKAEYDLFKEIDYSQESAKLLVKKRYNDNCEYTKIAYQNEFLKRIYDLETIGITPIEHLHLERLPLLSTILTILIQYALDHDPLSMSNLKLPEMYQTGNTLLLSENAIKQLHLSEIYSFIDHTMTNMGSRLLKDRLYNPYIEYKTITNIINNTMAIMQDHTTIRAKLKSIRDLDRFQRRLSTLKYQRLELNDTFQSINGCLSVLEQTRKKWNHISNKTIQNIKSLLKTFTNYINFDSENSRLFNLGKYIELDQLYDKRDKLLKEFQSIKEILEETGPLKIGTTNDTLYLIPNKANITKLKKSFDDIIVKSTKSECRIITPRIEEISTILNEVKEKIEQTESEKFIEFCTMVANKFSKTISKMSAYIAEIDLCCNSCYLMKQYNYILPEIITDNNKIEITKLRHPLIEAQSPVTYITNDLSLSKEEMRGMLLYGQNFSGKTSYIRSVGVAIILGQSGLPVAATIMKFQPITKLITKIALGDSLQRGQSTFTNEMKEIKNMIETTDSRSLILADELCSGTEPDSAISLVASALIALDKNKCKYIFTTHFHDLASIPQIMSITSLKIFHMKVSITDGKMIFNRLLEPGKCEDNYGIEIAQHMKMPTEYIHEAIMIRKYLQNTKELISTKKSRYNSTIYMTECKICKSKENLHTHHIIFQSDHAGKSKNNKNNLIILCEDCHIKVHKNDLDISGYIQTSKGIDIIKI
jgi:DNA mismatch repair protein MutS